MLKISIEISAVFRYLVILFNWYPHCVSDSGKKTKGSTFKEEKVPGQGMDVHFILLLLTSSKRLIVNYLSITRLRL